MLTPVEMQGRELKAGRGYQKKEADEFLAEIFRDYETLYREHMELKDKINTLTDGLSYYKDLEKTLQKTLVVAEKAAEETTKVAEKKAALLLADAQVKASQIVQEANAYFEKAQGSIKLLMQQYESYRIQCRKLADANLELLDSDAFKVDFELVGLTLPSFAMPVREAMTADSLNAGERKEQSVVEDAALSEETANTSKEVSREKVFLSGETAGSTVKKVEAAPEAIDLSAEAGQPKPNDWPVSQKTTESVQPKADDRSDVRKKNTKEPDQGLDTELFEFFNLGEEE